MAKFNDGGETTVKSTKLQPGDTFTFPRKNAEGATYKNADGSTATVTIKRTDRPYVYDLCDAYNLTMLESAKERGLEYFVDGDQVRLGIPEEYSKARTVHLARTAEDERQRMQHRARYPAGGE